MYNMPMMRDIVPIPLLTAIAPWHSLAVLVLIEEFLAEFNDLPSLLLREFRVHWQGEQLSCTTPLPLTDVFDWFLNSDSHCWGCVDRTLVK